MIALLPMMMNTLVLLPTTTCDTMQCDSIQFWPPSNLTDYHELPPFWLCRTNMNCHWKSPPLVPRWLGLKILQLWRPHRHLQRSPGTADVMKYLWIRLIYDNKSTPWGWPPCEQKHEEPLSRCSSRKARRDHFSWRIPATEKTWPCSHTWHRQHQSFPTIQLSF